MINGYIFITIEVTKESPDGRMSVQSIIQRVKRDGSLEGMIFTQRDLDFVKFTAKWWCVNPDLFLRKTFSKSEWESVYLNNENLDWRKSHYHSLTRRVNRLVKLEQYAPLTSGRVDIGSLAYWCTPSGGELIGAPWRWRYLSGNITRAKHAWAACDIGISLEQLGYTVYSEREFAAGEAVDHEPVAGGKFLNTIDGSQSVNKNHGKRPDLAIAGDDDKFIFIEVERETGRGEAKYRSKLESYYAHDRIAAVWYIVENPTTAKNIKAVEEELKLVSRNMPVRVLRLDEGFYDYKYSKSFEGKVCQEDLELIGANKVRSVLNHA